jgi:antitoxin (DNA-binding transcriptional repressor) of toxin-antitoxin stability system
MPGKPEFYGKALDFRAGTCYVISVMKSTLSVSKAQARFPELLRRKETTPITRSGEVVAFLVPRARMEALLEQMEILANPEAMKAIRLARAGKMKSYPLSALDEN